MTDFIQDAVNKSIASHSLHESKGYWRGAFDENSNDTKRHMAMIDEAILLFQFIDFSPDSVLTIGDHFARDAAYLKRKFGAYAVASDLNTEGIRQAQEDGYVDGVVDINVEDISYDSSSFSLVFAKESFHHFPRPMLGLYEMLRVARDGICLIEPHDVIPHNVYNHMSTKVREQESSASSWRDDYEIVGNYKYLLSIREVCKAAWALRLPAVIYQGFNDPYSRGFRFEEWIQKKHHLDQLVASGARQGDLVAVFIVKNPELLKRISTNKTQDSRIILKNLPFDKFLN